MVEGVEGGGEGVEGDEADDLAETVEIEDRVSDGLGVLANLVDAMGLEERVAGRRLIEQVQRHGCLLDRGEALGFHHSELLLSPSPSRVPLSRVLEAASI